MSKIFLDTNILVYSLDQGSAHKHKISNKILENLATTDMAVISTQILQEFYAVATRKFNVAPLLVKSIIHSMRHYETVVVTPDLISEAIDCSVLNRFSFWDALIIVSAESANCQELWTEDLNDGQIIRGVKITNPFAVK